MNKNYLVPMPGTEKLEEFAHRQELIRKLEKLHKEQRGWQRLVDDEELDYEKIEKIPTDQLEKIVEELTPPW